MMDAAHALTRFGLGRKAGEPLPADPRGWALDQLQPMAAPAAFQGLPDTDQAIAIWKQVEEQRRQNPQATDKVHPAHAVLVTDAAAQLDYAVATDAPFRERLVWFWANHFTVSTKRGEVITLAGAFVREAIRPHVTGRFVDMLMAVMRHPAMLLYLDNTRSIGPDSKVGLAGNLGLNENLARESLELHTITPAAGYTQADVTGYARILTGWSVRMNDPRGFHFRADAHEPGPQTLMGQSFPDGEAGGIAARSWLGTHPAAYHGVATALARHFIADTPPPDAVARIAARLSRSGGNLGDAAAAVVAEPGAWHKLTKLRSPQDYVVATARALGPAAPGGEKLMNAMNMLGQPIWTAPLPNGWPDRAADWADPESLLRRADWAYTITGTADSLDPDDLAQTALGDHIRPATRDAMQHAASRREAMTLLLSSPEFMRR